MIAAVLAALSVSVGPAIASDAACAGCHPARTAEWEGSGHAQSWTSPLFQAGLAVERRQFCVDCHVPVPSVADAARGIGCVDCHAPAAAHGAHAVASLRAADACKRCHEFATPEWDGGNMRMTALPMQSTYSEWLAYRGEGGAGTCQSCHMPGGDHAMHGAHDVDLLRRALDVRATVDNGVAAFTMRSVRVGHRYPTGDLFRSLTLEVDEGGGWRTIARAGRAFDTRLDEATLAAHKVETANTTLAPGESRTVTVAAAAPLAWRVRYHYGSERDEQFARVSYDALVVTLAAGRTGTAAPSKPASKLPPGFVDLAELAPDVVVDMRYAGADNFLGRPARGYGAARCLLTKEAARALAAVQHELATFGVGLKVYDCYRPQRAVDDFVAWSRAPGPATDPRHNPAVPKSELFQRGYIAARSGHSRGSTVDLTLVPAVPQRATRTTAPQDCRTVDGAQAPDASLNMGTTFDCFDERADAAAAEVSPEARRNRLLLRMAMEKHGFAPYAQEWWHFTLANEPFPRTAFDFEIQPAP